MAKTRDKAKAKDKDKSLEETLEEVTQENENTTKEKTIAQREKENAELGETCKRAQFDYINLKADMDLLQRRTTEKEANMQIDILIDTSKKFLPFMEELRKSLENIPEDKKEDPLTKGLQLTYNKFIAKLKELNITAIPALGEEPDSQLHEPVSMAPTKDKKLKWKIIQEFERGFIYEKDGIKKIVKPSKVVIWQ